VKDEELALASRIERIKANTYLLRASSNKHPILGPKLLNKEVDHKEVGMMVSLDHSIYFHNPRAFRADEWMLFLGPKLLNSQASSFTSPRTLNLRQHPLIGPECPGIVEDVVGD
jgi:hypothetical protein